MVGERVAVDVRNRCRKRDRTAGGDGHRVGREGAEHRSHVGGEVADVDGHIHVGIGAGAGAAERSDEEVDAGVVVGQADWLGRIRLAEGAVGGRIEQVDLTILGGRLSIGRGGDLKSVLKILVGRDLRAKLEPILAVRRAAHSNGVLAIL